MGKSYKKKKGLQKNQKGKPNSDLRLEARKCGVTLTEVGKWLGCKPAMMSYWLNQDLNEDQRFAIVAAIDCAKEEKKRSKRENNLPKNKEKRRNSNEENQSESHLHRADSGNDIGRSDNP